MKVYFFLLRARLNRKGLCPIVCRVSASETDRYDFRTKIFIEPDRWDAQRGMPKDNMNFIIPRLNKISSALYKLITLADHEATPADIVTLYREPIKKKLRTLKEVEAEMFERKMFNTNVRKRMSAGLAQFIKYTRNLSITKVTQAHIEGFYREQMKVNSDYTVDKKLQHVKRLFTYAQNNNYIQLSPFVNFIFPSLRTLDPIHLSDNELKQLTNKELKVQRLEFVRDLFVFQCHTGFAFKDIFAFSRDIVSQKGKMKYLDGKRQKNGKPYYLPFWKQAEMIAEKYDYNFSNRSNQKYNAYLKEIADLCEIKKNLTSHAGRKTFAQRMIDVGFSAETISKMMGHTSFDMTQKHYGRISEARIEGEIKKLKIAA